MATVLKQLLVYFVSFVFFCSTFSDHTMSEHQPPPISREAVREIDRRAIAELGLSGVVLMENAGRGAAELLLRLGVAGPVVICCGKGNNGGDGFVIARHLDIAGVATRVLLFCNPGDVTGDAAINLRVLQVAEIGRAHV